MPDYNPLEEIDQSQPLDMSKMSYSAWDNFKAALSSSAQGAKNRINVNYYGEAQQFKDNPVIYNLYGLNANPDRPESMPATQEDIDALQEDHPGLKAPVGIPKWLLTDLAEQHANDQYMNKLKDRPSSFLGVHGAFGNVGGWLAEEAGSLVGSLRDPKQFVAGSAGANLAAKFVAPIASGILTKLASEKIFGSAAPTIGTIISASSSSAVDFAGFGLGSQSSIESDVIRNRGVLGQKQDYIENLQNVGSATLYGAIAGMTLGAIGATLLGRRVNLAEKDFIEVAPETEFTEHGRYETPEEAKTAAEEHAQSTPIEHEYKIEKASDSEEHVLSRKGKAGVFEAPPDYVRQGGLFNRPEFQEFPQTVKNYIARVFKPWTKEADTVMKTEAAGQMANGQAVNLVPVIKQGMAEEGSVFRESIASGQIDSAALDARLAEAQTNIIAEIETEREGIKVDRKQSRQLTAEPEKMAAQEKIQGRTAKVDDLVNQHQVAQTMRDHLNAAIEPVSNGEVQAYAEHLKSPGIPDSGVSIDPGERTTIDEQLRQYTPEDMKTLMELAEKGGDKSNELKKAIDNAGKVETFGKMTRQMVDCILKGLL